MVFWPEFSHGNSLYLYYFTRNSWDADVPSMDTLILDFCEARYEKKNADEMFLIWKKMLPIAKLMTWTSPKTKDIFGVIEKLALFDPEESEKNARILSDFMQTKDDAMYILTALTKITLDDEKMRRDAYDIARTVISRFIDAAILHAEIRFAKGDADGVLEASRIAVSLLEYFAMLLGGHEDYSLLASLERLKTETETNPNFEKTLKNNAECEYNRAHIYENVAYLYLPETKVWLDAAVAAAKVGAKMDGKGLTVELEKIRSVYFETPLAEMKRESMPLAEVADRTKKIIGELKNNT
jgi:hypothetical protein